MTDMLTMIRSLGDQLRWAADLKIPVIGHDQDFVLAGMGGSGIGGDYVSAVTGSTPLGIYGHKGYSPLPGWVHRVEPVVVGVSYSGNTEETLSVVDEAADRGLTVVAVTTGGELKARADAGGWPTIDVPTGLQPRAALGYLFGAALRIVGEVSGHSDFVSDLREAADTADEITSEDSPGWAHASEIADHLHNRVTIVYGGGPVSATAAQRWKTQINENAKMPAWWSALPELDHNEIVGWETLPELTSTHLGVVALADRDDHERVGQRYRFTRSLTEDAVPWSRTVDSTGESAVARLISLTAVGDVVSWMLAENAGVDPVPVGTIEKLKRLLVEEEG